MKTRVFRLACLALFVLGAVGVWTALGATYVRPTDTRSPYELVQAADLARFRVDLSRIGRELDGRSSVDVSDQLRDWAVLGTLLRARLDPTVLQMNNWRSPAVRRPYLEDSFLFEYGRGRTAVLDDDHVLLMEQGGRIHQRATAFPRHLEALAGALDRPLARSQAPADGKAHALSRGGCPRGMETPPGVSRRLGRVEPGADRAGHVGRGPRGHHGAPGGPAAPRASACEPARGALATSRAAPQRGHSLLLRGPRSGLGIHDDARGADAPLGAGQSHGTE